MTLPALVAGDVEQVAPGVYCLDTGLFGPRRVAAWLVGQPGAWAFVDCGPGRCAPRLLAALGRLDIDPGEVAYVLPTHVHLDHAGGAGALLAALPRARLLAHARGVRHLVDPAALWAGAVGVYGEALLLEHYGALVPVPEARIAAVSDGMTVALGSRTLRFVDSPGHARHHYAVWDEASRSLFAGDTFGLCYRELDSPAGPYVLPSTSPVQFEPEAWPATLDAFIALEPLRVCVAHYGVVPDPAPRAQDLRRRLADYARIGRELAQQPDRHARLVRALRTAAHAELRALGSPARAARIDAILDLDLDLNATGIEVWLDRAAARHGG